MGKTRKDQLLGKLDLLVLRVLTTGESMHGYAIAERIEQLSENVLQVGEGSLYPALHRMDEEGWIRSEWAASDNNRRARYYRITAAWPAPTGGRRSRVVACGRGDYARVEVGVMGLLHRFLNVLRPGRLEVDLDDELDFHRDMRRRKASEQGLGPEDAERAANLRMGNVLLAKEQMRDARLIGWLTSSLQDLRHGLVLLRAGRGHVGPEMFRAGAGAGNRRQCGGLHAA